MIVSPWKMPSISLADLGQAEDLRQRPVGGEALEPLDGAGAEDQDAMAPLAAHRLLPGEGGDVELRPGQVLREGRRGGVAEGEAGAVGGDPVGVRDAGARGGAVPGEADVGVGPNRAEVGQRAVVGGQHPAVGEPELLGRVGRPALAEALPDQHVDRARAQHRPHRHLEGAGVGGRHDADAVVLGHAEQLRGAVDRLLQLRLRLRGAVRAAEERARGDRLGGPAGPLRAGTRGELGACRLWCGLAGAATTAAWGWLIGQLHGQGEVTEPAPLALVRGRCPEPDYAIAASLPRGFVASGHALSAGHPPAGQALDAEHDLPDRPPSPGPSSFSSG